MNSGFLAVTVLDGMNGARGTKATAPYVVERSTTAAVESFMVATRTKEREISKEKQKKVRSVDVCAWIFLEKFCV